MTHGTLTNKTTCQTLTGEVTIGEGSSLLTIRIDGCRASNTFYPVEWDFTPDLEPLPTEPGLYVSDAPGFEYFTYRLTAGGWWSKGFSRANIPLTDDEMHYRLPLVRLVREDERS